MVNSTTSGIPTFEIPLSTPHSGIRKECTALLERHFTKPEEDVFKSITWTTLNAQITDAYGKPHFILNDVEAPESWSQMAINIVASKYFKRGATPDQNETSIRQLVLRVVDTITRWGKEDGYLITKEEQETFRSELSYILLHQRAAFNSPVWFNVGVYEKPQCSACFILSVEDSIDSLVGLQALEARIFKHGSGSGTNLSTLRSSKEKLSGGGTPSGPVSFMRGFDAWANIIKSGGKTRRAAKMQMLDISHPDILEFIHCKAKEEKKAWALKEAGFQGAFGEPGGAYDSVAFQNANLSVRVSDEFMNAAEKNATYWTRRVSDGEKCEELNAREVLRSIAESTHACGDPGMQFDTTINRWHTCPESGRINGSNPCSEYMHVDNSACNLASINLLKFFNDHGEFDTKAFRHTVGVLITAQDILVDRSSYPSPTIAKNAHDFRQLGLGYANLGAVLMSLGLPYDSDEGRNWAGALGALMTGEAYRQSAILAGRKGSFKAYSKNRKAMLKVVRSHREALNKLTAVTTSLTNELGDLWNEVVTLGETSGYRNAQATVLAPTGTISFMMDCDTTGIEPDIALVKYKQLSGGGFLKLVNTSVVRGLKALGYSDNARESIARYIAEKGTIEGSEDIKERDLPVFDCALKPISGSRHIHYMGHLKMMAAVQPFLSGAISKTVNLPQEVTPDDIAEVYLAAWKLGIKAVALYRDGSKSYQPLTVKEKDDSSTKKVEIPKRRKLPDERPSITHKFNVGGLEGYITVGLFDDGSPGEIFIVVAKEGSTLSGVMDAFATAVSLALQYGVPLNALVKKFTHLRFDPAGFTTNKDIPMAKSLIDYIFKWLGLKFLSHSEQMDLGISHRAKATSEDTPPVAPSNDASAQSNGFSTARKGNTPKGNGEIASTLKSVINLEDSPPCTVCGSGLMVRQGACYVCLNCGSQGGCG